MQRLNDTMMRSEIQLNLKIHSDMDEAVDDCCDKVFAIIEIVDEEDEDSWYPPSVLGGGTHSLTHLLTHSLTCLLTHSPAYSLTHLLAHSRIHEFKQ